MTLEGDEVVRVPAYPVETVDTTGAGDSFNAGFLHRWLAGAPIADCLRLGAACGALSTLGLGGTAAQPTLEEAESLVRAGRR
jgi:sugar/nucleoside kinase (ribokinase family)